MDSNFADESKVKELPSEGVHCFPASGKQIVSRRIVTVILMLAFAAMAVYFFLTDPMNIILACFGIAGFIISLLVFIQTFLIAKYRVAIDYTQKRIVLRYRYSTIQIPFENFDAREGTPDKAEQLIDNSVLSADEGKTYYLILDNVYEDACFQTATKDLASREDFFQLKKEALAIAEAYGARNDENKVKMYYEKDQVQAPSSTGDDVEDIVANAKSAAEAEEASEPAETDDNK